MRSAHAMLTMHGMPLDVFFAQDLALFLRVTDAADNEPVYFIDEV